MPAELEKTPTPAPTPATEHVLEPLRARPGAAAIVCDVDGTLAPIVSRPEDAVVPDVARTLLEELSGRFGLVACLSGRQAEEARRIVGVPSLTYVGNHGLEVLRPGAATEQTVPADGQVEAVRAFVAGLDRDTLARAGISVEDKQSIVSLHWRRAPDERSARELLGGIARQAETASVRPHWGRKVLELRPRAGVDKGTALASLVREARAATALYGGDDTTDVDAFRALRALREDGALEHAVCVGVRSDEAPAEITAEADLLVDGPAGFVAMLTLLVR